MSAVTIHMSVGIRRDTISEHLHDLMDRFLVVIIETALYQSLCRTIGLFILLPKLVGISQMSMRSNYG